jgi:two-component system, chemotaxis family, chemotaxis protein CheY
MTTRILVVDDAAMVRAQLRAALPRTDYEVLDACDGLEALAKLEANPAVKLIVLDIHMPNMNGLECLEVLRARGSTVPVIVLTAEADPEVVRRAKALGAKGWLKKPLKAEFLLPMVTKAITTLEAT